MQTPDTFATLAIALGLGLLVGLQRERGPSRIAGIRTFPLITLLGCVCAMLSTHFGGWVLGVGLLGVIALALAGNFLVPRSEQTDPGITTEVAMLLMFCVGAMLLVMDRAPVVAIGAGVAVLLHAKSFLHGFARRIGDEDFRAIAQFVVISLIILPILPNTPYGPHGTLNPYITWLMVVLVVGISLAGYMAYKFFGQRAGILLGGLLGGAISSTATTVSYARRARETPQFLRPAIVVLVIACVVVYARVLIEIVAVEKNLLPIALGPIAVLALISLLLALLLWIRVRRESPEIPEQSNPSELKSALVFGALYAIVRLATAFARDYFGDSGLYAVALISGLTDMDAITLSVSRMFKDGLIEGDTAWRAIVIATGANLLFKAILAGVLGGRRLFARIAPLFALSIIAALLMLWLWPDIALWSVTRE